ncbi:MAG: right-handed parallel beta-helix repeat-containing protein [Verrucomicrobia bacterium]|nr:right-handed parallel beta-helix repeat-containing protein [Verrucomicrobiota bacterium]
MVFEPFAGAGYTNGASLAGLAGGFGFAGPWPSVGGVIRDSLSFGTFPSGGAAVHCDSGGGQGFSASRPLAPTVWPTAGQTFWMSYLILPGNPGDAGCSVDGQFLVEVNGGGGFNRVLFLDLVPNDGTNGVHSDGVFPDGPAYLIVAKFSNYANGSPANPQTGTAWGLTSAQYEALANAGFTEAALDSNNTARITQSINYPAAFTQGLLTLGGYSGTKTVVDFDEIRIGLTPDSVLAPSPLLIAPAGGVVRSGKPMTFAALGGQPPYSFSFLTNRSGGALDPATGFYIAGPAVYVFDVVQVADTLGNTAVATLEVWPQGFMVTTTADSGPGSFRQGLLDANANLADGRISFNLPGAGPHKIAPLTPLPSPNSDVVIDGYTQPGSRPNTLAQGTDALLMIELSGENTTGAALDWFGSASVTVRGLCINRWNLAIGTGCLTCGTGVGYTPGVVIAGCFIGTDPTGTQPRPNGDGVFLSEAYGGRLGGPEFADRNLISGNTRLGVGLGDDSDSFTHNITIQNNLIGTDRTGANALGNGGDGIGSFDAGGSGVFITNFFIADNVIGANGGAGIRLTGESDYHRLVRNLIGVGADGLTPMGNGQEGIILSGNGNLLGGTNGTDGNVIAHNALAGVRLTSGRANAILGNRIFHNGGLAIDLGPLGVTANDPGDLDTGPNDLQNKPVLLAATPFESGMTVSGTLNSLPNAAYRVEFFKTPICPRDNPPEAGHFLGSTNVATDASGNASITASLPGVFGAGLISATASDTNGNTSEVSTDLVYFVGTGFRPTLYLPPAGPPFRVFWPTNPAGFLLETNADVGDPCGWQVIPTTPGVSGTNFFEDISPLAPRLFFRLRRLVE